MRKKHLVLKWWEMEECCKDSLSAGSEAGRYLLNRKPASVTGTHGTKRGDASYRLLSIRSIDLGRYSKSYWKSLKNL